MAKDSTTGMQLLSFVVMHVVVIDISFCKNHVAGLTVHVQLGLCFYVTCFVIEIVICFCVTGKEHIAD